MSDWRPFDPADQATWPPLEHSMATVRVLVCFTPLTPRHFLRWHPEYRVAIGVWRFRFTDGGAPYWDVAGAMGVAWLDDEVAHWQPLPEPVT